MTQPADVPAEVQKAIAELEAQFLAEMPRYRWTADQVIAENDVTRLKGKNVIVTGATSGIGIPTALAFAKTGCHLTVTTRDAAKAAAVEAQYRSVAEAAGGSVTFVSLDLTSFSSARQFVAAWGAKPIDLLVHNAGVMASPFTLTPDGEELQMQTNFLSLVVITEGLRAFLAEKARVVILSSRAHRFVMDADFLPLFRYYLTTVKSDASKYEKWACYGVTKSLEVMYAKVLSEEFEAENRSVRAVAVHPGGIATNLLQYLSPEETTRMQLSVLPGRTNPLQKTPEQGAATTVWAAVSPDLEGVGGAYCENCTVTPPDFCSPGGFSWNTPDAKLMRGVAPHVSKPDVYRTAVAETRAYLASKALL